jgi:site-specific DNA-methyltransferase (adenine-specific)
MYRDEIRSKGALKELHKWEQPVDGCVTLVKHFSKAGDTVCDPFLGSGTTGVAAVGEARRFVGADVDAGTVAAARRRLGIDREGEADA